MILSFRFWRTHRHMFTHTHTHTQTTHTREYLNGPLQAEWSSPSGRPARLKQDCNVWIRPQSSLLCADSGPGVAHARRGCGALGKRVLNSIFPPVASTDCRPNRPHTPSANSTWAEIELMVALRNLAQSVCMQG